MSNLSQSTQAHSVIHLSLQSNERQESNTVFGMS